MELSVVQWWPYFYILYFVFLFVFVFDKQSRLFWMELSAVQWWRRLLLIATQSQKRPLHTQPASAPHNPLISHFRTNLISSPGWDWIWLGLWMDIDSVFKAIGSYSVRLDWEESERSILDGIHFACLRAQRVILDSFSKREDWTKNHHIVAKLKTFASLQIYLLFWWLGCLLLVTEQFSILQTWLLHITTIV